MKFKEKVIKTLKNKEKETEQSLMLYHCLCFYSCSLFKSYGSDLILKSHEPKIKWIFALIAFCLMSEKVAVKKKLSNAIQTKQKI